MWRPDPGQLDLTSLILLSGERGVLKLRGQASHDPTCQTQMLCQEGVVLGSPPRTQRRTMAASWGPVRVRHGHGLALPLLGCEGAVGTGPLLWLGQGSLDTASPALPPPVGPPAAAPHWVAAVPGRGAAAAQLRPSRCRALGLSVYPACPALPAASSLPVMPAALRALTQPDGAVSRLPGAACCTLLPGAWPALPGITQRA